MFIQLCDKTIFSSLFSPSCTALELNNSTQKKYWGGGGMNFAEQNFAMESISIIFENLLSRFRVKIAKINSAKITACEYFCSLAT